MTTAIIGHPVQIAYVTPDPVTAAGQWASRYGAGPFFVMRHVHVSNVVHRSSPSTFDHTSAYGWWGDTMIELLCQHDDTPSVVRERFAAHESGLHHVASFVVDLDIALERCGDAGLRTAMTALAGGTRFAFVDAVADTGHFWELYEPTDGLRGFYAMVRNAHQDWDQRDPVRMLS